MQCSKIRKEWREAFTWLYRSNPKEFRGERVEIVVHHEVKGRWQDPVSCAECFKAALDGLVDGGLIEDDSPQYVRSVTFMQPIKTGRDALTLTVRSVTES